MSSHHLHDNGTFMTRRGSVQAIKRVHHRRHSRVKTERHRRCFQIVVNRFRNADAVDSSLLQLQRGCHRAIPPDATDARYTILAQDLARLFDYFRRDNSTVAGPDLGNKMTTIRCSDKSPSERHDIFGALAVENREIAGWK